jgi:uncharacterized lipoprotein YmbA
MMSFLRALAIGVALAAFVTGCSSPAAHFYTLTATAAPGGATSRASVAVGPVSIPNQVSIDDFNRWAAPVQDNLARVVADNLVALLGTPRVTLYPTLAADVEFRVQIEVRNFDSAPGKYALLDAVWTVRRMKDGKSETGRSSVRETITDSGYDALAAAHSRAVARMSQDIADAVLALERAPA